jgi:hypothetical protein
MGERVSSPSFVGRVEELGLLAAALGRAGAGEPGTVLVAGEAGVPGGLGPAAEPA